MKTAQDFNSNFEQYKDSIERKISNLHRMCFEMKASGVVAQRLIVDLSPVLEKLHLTIGEFTMNRPDELRASNCGALNLTLLSDGKFKFVTFRGYTSRGSGKNEDHLYEKAAKICRKVEDELKTSKNELRCSVNQYSLETRDDKETGRVLMTITYNF